jgi:hypothetical protein
VGLYIDHSDVDRLYRLLRERGLDIDPPRVQWAMNAIHMRDPDGYGLTFQTPVAA